MPKIKFITHDDKEFEVTADVGGSVMEAALDNNVPGIDADCGGSCSCATCHVWVDEAFRAKVGPPGDMEEDMLCLNEDRQEGSRLSCQIEVSDELDGLVVRVPEFQM